RFNNNKYLNNRIEKLLEPARGSVKTILKYLYNTDGPTNAPPDRYKQSLPFLEDREVILLNWLKTRTNGKLRKSYGKNSLIAARNAFYRCEKCKYPDVRALNLDHIHGKNSIEFSCLCANCHSIKSRKHDWLGKV
ncbi:MAG: hypothetical protein PF693_01005, partial [Spirochaetia bacterium]|nr:hypothetical protein [Spirochaetia bacterium]